MKKIIVKKESLKEIHNQLKRSEEAFDSFLTSIEDGLLEEDWKRIKGLESPFLTSKSMIAKILRQSKTMNRKGKGGEINQSEIIMKNERHKLVDKKKYNGHNFEVYISSESSNGYIALTVRCLTIISKENITLCLKVLNVANEGEIQGKYSLDPKSHIISCQTIHERKQRSWDILNCLKEHVECSMDCLLDIYGAVEKNDLEPFGRHALKKVYYNLP